MKKNRFGDEPSMSRLILLDHFIVSSHSEHESRVYSFNVSHYADVCLGPRDVDKDMNNVFMCTTMKWNQ